MTEVVEVSQRTRAWLDVKNGIAGYRVWMALAQYEIRQRYRRSILGPFWITITMMVLILGMGPLYGSLFGLSLDEFIPFLAMGVISWGLISSLILEGCSTFINAENLVRSVKLPFTVHVMRVLYRNLIVFAHNLVAFIPFMLYLGIEPHWRWFAIFPGVALVVMAAFPMIFLLGTLCTRFRDLQQIIASIVQLAFFLTPIFWKPELLKGRIYFAEYNPFHLLLEVIRGPIVDDLPSAATYGKVVAMIVLLNILAVPVYVRYRRRLAFWV
ncbi:ABC transporter permease [Pseudomonas sp. CGJS7]|uniref:ABC transporter permease n=1 Tax=Pseudomonas sp. CGJS7 TaxID=3109348 RepID=UPI0030087B37